MLYCDQRKVPINRLSLSKVPKTERVEHWLTKSSDFFWSPLTGKVRWHPQKLCLYVFLWKSFHSFIVYNSLDIIHYFFISNKNSKTIFKNPTYIQLNIRSYLSITYWLPVAILISRDMLTLLWRAASLVYTYIPLSKTIHQHDNTRSPLREQPVNSSKCI